MKKLEKDGCLGQLRSLSILAFSPTGYEAGKRLKQGLEKTGMQVTVQGKSKYLPQSVPESLQEWTGRQFEESRDGILFIGSCGIAVRAIAPFVDSKKTDPAVVVMDERGTFVISLLSGHLGGANELTQVIAQIMDAVPVVTTATDVHGRFAVDVFAKKNHCSLIPLKGIKAVSAALLAGERVGFYSEFPVKGELPAGLVECTREGNPQKPTINEKPAIGIAVTMARAVQPFDTTLWVVPPCVTAGMGCKKNTPYQALEEALAASLKELGIFPEALGRIASIDLKAKEPGLLNLCQSRGIPYVTYSKEVLGEVKGQFTASAFVASVAGVDNVCERSAVLAAENGKLIQRKRAYQGITIALALEEWSVYFE